ncbi:tripartite tricarboxylate transporter TctB family protein [Virgibacillus ainsalahensis]
MKHNFVLSIVTIILSSIFLIFSLQIPSSDLPGQIGPRGWPVAVLLLMLMLGIILLIRSLKEKTDETIEKSDQITKTEIKEENSGENVESSPGFPRRHWIIMGVLLLYVFIMPWSGFPFATFILSLLSAWLLGMKKKVNIFIMAFVSSLVFSFIFITLLRIPLPRGINLFENISLLFQ